MKKIITKFVAPIFVIGVLAILGWGLFKLIKLTINTLTSINPSIATAIVAGSVTIIVSILSVIISRHLESRAQIRKEHREQKIPVYEDLIRFLFRILMADKLGNAPSEKEMIEFMSDFNQRLMVWGSDSVLKSFVTFRKISVLSSVSTDPTLMMLTYEDLLRNIRKDLGHKNQTIKRGDILSLFINDIDKYIKN